MRSKALFAAFGALCFLTAVWLGLPLITGKSLDQTAETVSSDAELAHATQEARNVLMAEELDAHFPEAPTPVRAIAATIIAGEIPSARDVEALDKDSLNGSWYRPHAALFPMHGHTLLRQAVVSRNIEAARVLMAAGANPFYNDNEMPFQAVNIETSTQRVAFSDYQLGTAFLTLWLDHDGDPNATHRGASLGPLLTSTPINNLESILLLLERGADPWLKTPVYSTGTDNIIFYTDPFHLSNANAAPISSEVAFRVAMAGHYANSPAEGIDELIRLYDRTAAQYVGASGPENLHLIWGMQMALHPIFNQIDRTPEGAIAQLLDMQIPDDIGGFFLAPNEIRSPDDEDQLINNLNQFGNEMWDVR